MDDLSAVPVSSRLELGQIVGEYQILSVAGTGGMGIVYRARQRSLERIVALKVIRADIARVPEYRERFLREARLAAAINDPHVVSVYDVGDDDELFLAMQWIDGEDLKRMIERSGALAPERAVALATQLGGALDAIHGGAGLIHRDVKPANVLVRQIGPSDHAYLTDFGVAKPSDSTDELTKTGWVVGTTGYLSPEQIRGEEPGPRSDLYALACVFFEALTGQPPFAGENEMAVRWAHASNPRPIASAVRPPLGQRYDDFLLTALAIDPAQRFSSGRELADALTAAHQGRGGTTSPIVMVPPHAQTAVGPPTPLPPAAMGPQATPQPYPAYAYATPPPAYQQSRSGSPLALVVLGLVALAGIAVGALAAAGVFSHKAAMQAVTGASTRAAATTSAPTTAPKHTQTSRSAPPAATTSCGGSISVGPKTSCGFAQNVQRAYDQTAGGDQTVSAYSPATGLAYTINCTGGSPHVCTGGTTTGASVYFTSGPAATSPPPTTSAPSPGAGGCDCTVADLPNHCDVNISSSSDVTCPFAENTFYEYYEATQADPTQQITIQAWSSATQQYYAEGCSPGDGVVDCIHGNGADVRFNQSAIYAYTTNEASYYATHADIGPNG